MRNWLFKISLPLFISFPLFLSAQTEGGLTAADTLRYLNIPDRPEDALTGTELAGKITGLDISDREEIIVRELLSGNVPSFARKLKPVRISQVIKDKSYELVYYALCDYLALGSDSDYLYIPLTPSTAQYIADKLQATLPTKKMVDDIYRSALNRLHPQPIPPSDKMTTVPVFMQHTDSIKLQIAQKGFNRLSDSIFAGNKKDIIISNKIYSPDRNYDRVVIYGWHLSENNPIQPVYNGHGASYADYSHGVRLISRLAFLNSDSMRIDSLLQDSDLSTLLSDEGVIDKPRYPDSKFLTYMEHPAKIIRHAIKLQQNYPNPFNPSTIISYQLPRRTRVELNIYNLLGQKIVTLVSGTQSAGLHKIKWQAPSLAGGIYIYRLNAGLDRQSRRMVLLR